MNFEKAKKQAKELVAQMTAEEKMSQLVYNAPAIERLGINEYNWWNEALHGVARAGTATVFPQSIAMAATFNPDLLHEVADVIATEGRAKYNKSIEYGDRDIFKGLTFWSPNINIFRDPRWGRGHETYGEDPCLTAVMGSAFVKGLQGDGEFYKSCACAKHLAVHSGPEKLRHGFDAKATEKDMAETYLPAFQKCVEAGVSGVMGSYNRINGIPANCHPIIEEKVRKEWGFDGYFVSDCGAINDIWKNHNYTDDAAGASALCLKAGCDLNCGNAYLALNEAYERDLVTDEELTRAAERLFEIRYLLGEFENNRPYADIPFTAVDCKAHRELNLKAAKEAVVLLKNENNFLPLDKDKIKNIGIVGPNAINTMVLEGNYEGRASEYVTVADGIRRVFAGSEIRVAEGCKYIQFNINDCDGNNNMLSDGIAVASVSDVTILCLGLNSQYEGEGDEGDKAGIKLPEIQQRLAEAVCDACDNVIVVMMCGSSIDPGEKVRNHAKAIIYGWYPGAQGGLAIADIIAGNASPCGRLPVTIYNGNTALPDFTDYSMKSRTYRYIECEPLYPFGFGLSYSNVKYDKAEITGSDEKSITVKVSLENCGRYDVTEKMQAYGEFADSQCETPIRQLCAVKPVFIMAGEKTEAEITIDKFWLKAVTDDGKRKEPDGNVAIAIGSSQCDNLSLKLGASQGIRIHIK